MGRNKRQESHQSTIGKINEWHVAAQGLLCGWRVVAFGALTLLAIDATAAAPYPITQCPADRLATDLNCTANDVEVASVDVLNNVTQCLAGDQVTLHLRANLHANAQKRYNVGIFMAQDGRTTLLTSANNGSAMCSTFGLPTSPLPFANLDSNVCGDFDSSGLPQGQVTPLDLGNVTVTCTPDADGYLNIPTVVTWMTNPNTAGCASPPAAYFVPESKSKCEAGISQRIPVQVLGKIVVTKQTIPDAAAGTFAFTATGSGASPTAFSLSDGQSQTVGTGPLSATPQTYTISEAALAGWGPGAQIQCLDADGDIASFVDVDNTSRTISAHLSVAFDQAFCTVTNEQQASITINKTTLGGDGSFDFLGSPNIAPFTIATSGGSGQHIISGLTAGTYSVAESIPAGWDLTNLACVDPTTNSTTNLASATATINLAAGENVTCTYTDTRRGAITVVKNTVGGNGTFNFTGPTSPTNPTGAFQITTSGGTGQMTFGDLPSGSYNLAESVPAGWDLTGLSCVDPSGGTTTAAPTAAVALAPGETVTCTFTDTRRASIVINKQALGADATFNFTGSQAFSITTSGGNGSNTAAFASVAPGTYTITESALAGWALTNLICVDPTNNSTVASPTATVNVAAGETVTCTFTNTRLATLVIIKQAVPHILPNPPSFPFTATGLTSNSFSLADDGTNANDITFSDVMPGGSYTVAEGTVANWVLTSITCTDENDANPANRSVINFGARMVTPNLQPGETLRCVFTNVRNDNGSIVVTKRTIGTLAAGVGGTFDFANSGGVMNSPTNPLTFQIQTTVANPVSSRALTELTGNKVYTITETPLAGWDLESPIQCVPTAGSSTTITQVPNGVTINLGITGNLVDAVACTFVNTHEASITIVKQATPQNAQDFTFNATGGNGVPASFALDDDADPTLSNTAAFSALPPGTYTFTEQAVAGWKLTSIACSGGAAVTTNPATGLATIDLSAGENVTCTYHNAKDATITITKTAVGGAGGETFAFSGPGSLAGSIGNGQSLSGSFPAGTYNVAEQVPAGWDLTNIVCSGGTVTITGAATSPTSGFEPGDTTVNITVAAGDTVSCTYTDTRRGVITIVKNTIGGDGTFGFTGSQTFAITTSAGSGSNTTAYADAVPGAYTITESAVAGWQLTGLVCSSGGTANLANSTATVNLVSGQQVTCTFTNTRLGSITIVKRIHDDSTTGFTFTVPAALDPALSFTLTPPVMGAEASRTFVDVAPGSYNVTEQVPATWKLIGVNCSDPTQNSATSLSAARATINLAAGESVTCTFDDTKLSAITISVVSVGGTGTFGFNSTNLGANSFALTTPADGVKASRLFTGLSPGTFTVDGLGATGWKLFDVQCVGEPGEVYWTISKAHVGINLVHGETLECTYFYNKLQPPPPPAPMPTPLLSPWMYALLAGLLVAVGGWWNTRRHGR